MLFPIRNMSGGFQSEKFRNRNTSGRVKQGNRYASRFQSGYDRKVSQDVRHL